MQIYAKTKLNTSIIWIFNLEHYFALEKKNLYDTCIRVLDFHCLSVYISFAVYH